MSEVKVKTLSEKKNAINKKWALILGGAVVSVIVLNGTLNKQPERAAPPPPLVNLTPDKLDQATLAQKTDAEITMLRDKTNELTRNLSSTTQSVEDLKALVQRQNESAQKNFEAINKGLLEINSKINADDRRLPAPTPTRGRIPQEPPAPPSLDAVKKQHEITTGTLPDLPPSPVAFGSMQDVTPKQAEEAQKTNGIYSPKNEDAKIFSPQPSSATTEQGSRFAGYLTTSFAPGVMLTGVSANTATTTKANPQPLLIRMQDNAFLPGEARYRVQSCFVMASAYGSLSDERAHIRLASISCVDKKTKRLLESPVKGYVVDGDGTFGLRGKLIEKRGAILAKTLLAGFAQGLSDAGSSASTASGVGALAGLSVQQTAESAAFGGLSSSAGKLADFYMKEAESMFPVIEVGSGRKLFVVFSEGTQLQWSDYENK
ncbi:TrbI/VirB10 family protein [Thiomicrospira sp.]|uniref:TrbI/VirB10 family protein n=1 Tax=Thiomicrospira sp. TaxID=935 RepID=UPI002F93594E